MTDVSYVTSGNISGQQTTLTDVLDGTGEVPAFNAGDLGFLQYSYNDTTGGGFTDVVPAGWARVPNGQSKFDNTTALQAIYYRILPASITAPTISRASGTGNMRGQIHIFRAADPSSPFGTTAAVTGSNSVTVAVSVPGSVPAPIPAGSMMVVFFTTSGTATASALSAGWTFSTIPTAASAVTIRMAYKAVPADLTAAQAVQYTQSVSRFFSGVVVVVKKVTASLQAGFRVQSVTSTGTLVGGAADMATAISDGLGATGIDVACDPTGDAVTIVGKPMVTPPAGKDLTIYLDEELPDGGAAGYQLWLAQGGSVVGSPIVQNTTGTSPGTLAFVIPASTIAAVSNPSTYWSVAPTVVLTPAMT